MQNTRQPTILCLASYYKGALLLEAARRAGARVILLTKESLAAADWPHDSIDELVLLPDPGKQLDLIYTVSYLARTRHIDQVLPLDEYDAMNAASLREHLRLPGLGETQMRFFRDKLAMRTEAKRAGLAVPPFKHVLHHHQLYEWMLQQPGPWLLKPRAEAASMGIKEIRAIDDVWPWLEQLGDQQSFWLLEQYIAGDVFHVDSIVRDGAIVFANVSQYGQPPLNVAHGGGVFTTRTLNSRDPQAARILAENTRMITAFGLRNGVTHAEFIRGRNGTIYFLEVAARVGGAFIDQVVQHATGVNLWAEWARVELSALRNEPYQLPLLHDQYAGLVLCLARQATPDLSAYTDREIVGRVDKPLHAGLIVAADTAARVDQLLASYSRRFADDFLAVAPPRDKPAP